MLKKLDFKKDFKKLFSPTQEPEMLQVPDFHYIMIDGKGDPNKVPDFQKKISLLYGLAFTIKFMLKKDKKDPFDFTVPPLSGLWCAEDLSAFTEKRKDEFEWTLMILLPDKVTNEIFENAKTQLKKKKNPAYIDQVYFKPLKEGLCAQIMHIGPYDEEGPTIEKLHQYFLEQNYTFNGKHHEIYLSDPRRTKPEKWRTIIRQPIKRK